MYTSILTADELYNVLLHEFAHVSNADTKLSAKFVSARERISTVEDNVILAFGQLLFLRLPASVLSFRVTSFLTVINMGVEAAADEFVKTGGNAQIYSDALAKSYMFRQYNETPNDRAEYEFYSSENCTDDYASRECAAFLAERDRMGKIWEEYIYKELPAKIDSHPTTITRIKNMGCSSFNAYAEEPNEFFRVEQQKLVKFADKIVTEAIKPYYCEYRKQEYDERKNIIDEYKERCDSGTELPESFLLKALQAFLGLDYEKTIEVADKIIDKNHDAPQANFLKGIALFSRYDDNCIECFKTAAKCFIYTDEAYDFLGRYALKTGNEELLSEYRATVADIVQNARDKNKQSRFTRNTTLEPHDLSGEEIEALTKGLIAATDDHVAKIHVCKYTDPFGESHYVVAITLCKVKNTNVMWSLLGKASNFLDFHSDKHRFDLAIGRNTLRRKIIKADNSLIYDRRAANKKQ